MNYEAGNINNCAVPEYIKSAVRVIDTEIACLLDLKNNLSPILKRVLDEIVRIEGRVIVTGIGKSGIICRKIVASLASTGTPAMYVHPSEASHGDLGMITTKDFVIAISNSGESKELVDILNYCKENMIPLTAITKNKNSSLAKASNYVLLLPTTKEACPLGLAPTSSTTATLVLGDIITVGLMELRLFTSIEFNKCHPGGKLGTILQKVCDIMHVDKNMPLLSEDSNMSDVLMEMTTKRLGCVGFVNDSNELTGIFTDGDLRRRLNKELFELKGKDVMTKNPKTLQKDTLCSEALAFLKEHHITNLFILQDKVPLGVIHIHDLLTIK